MQFSKAKMKGFFRKVSNLNVGNSASTQLNKELETYGLEISEVAIEKAEEASRKTVQKQDIKEAIKEVEK